MCILLPMTLLIPRLPLEEALQAARSTPGGPADPKRRSRLETCLMEHYRDSGSEAAFLALHELASPGLVHWVRHLQGSRYRGIDAVEVAQDTWCAIVRYGHSYKSAPGNSFGSWARTIAANALRRAAKRSLRETPVDPQELPAQVDPGPGPSRCASDAEERHELRASMILLLGHLLEVEAGLSPRDRRALDLVELQGLRQDRAARELEVGLSNMKMILFRARRRLAKGLGERLGVREVQAVLRAS